ncbi:hypothetical protein AVEN_40256-1 [Araneus ventricosus]|uniref:Uncharacterized protein n=1 Tax=Araneus ventricosus TaxID=182803 RepID=A0A4Y2PQX5_ARAVE|nr:hypothetical protein AVEN_40256-1 [Araneus ventricosus]
MVTGWTVRQKMFRRDVFMEGGDESFAPFCQDRCSGRSVEDAGVLRMVGATANGRLCWCVLNSIYIHKRQQRKSIFRSLPSLSLSLSFPPSPSRWQQQ